MDDWGRVLGRAEYHAKSDRVLGLMREVLSKFPAGVPAIQSVVEIRMERRAAHGTVGLTVYRIGRSGGDQTITFYGELLDQLSDDAAKGVIVHELAHAWLNEHVSPESSMPREMEADELARAWGFGSNLDALAEETDPF